MVKESTQNADLFIGQQIRTARMLRRMTLNDLGQELGLSYQQIQKYETGINRISASMLMRVATSLEVPIGFFFDEEFQTTEIDSERCKLIALQLASIPNEAIRHQLEELIRLNMDK